MKAQALAQGHASGSAADTSGGSSSSSASFGSVFGGFLGGNNTMVRAFTDVEDLVVKIKAIEYYNRYTTTVKLVHSLKGRVISRLLGQTGTVVRQWIRFKLGLGDYTFGRKKQQHATSVIVPAPAIASSSNTGTKQQQQEQQPGKIDGKVGKDVLSSVAPISSPAAGARLDTMSPVAATTATTPASGTILTPRSRASTAAMTATGSLPSALSGIEAEAEAVAVAEADAEARARTDSVAAARGAYGGAVASKVAVAARDEQMRQRQMQLQHLLLQSQTTAQPAQAQALPMSPSKSPQFVSPWGSQSPAKESPRLQAQRGAQQQLGLPLQSGSLKRNPSIVHEGEEEEDN